MNQKKRKTKTFASFMISGAAGLIIVAAIISFNAEKIYNLLVTYLYKSGFVEKFESYENDSNFITNEDEKTYEGPYPVKRIIDGDTFVVIIDDTEAKIRLIGVDTPEYVASDDTGDYKENVDEGKTAYEYTKKILSNKEVYLEYDISKIDKYGRILAYVYYDENSQLVMLNKKLLTDGMAKLMTVQPNVKYVDEFTEAQQIAKEAGTGFWGNNVFSENIKDK